MYLERLWVENAARLTDGEWRFAATSNAIRKWTVWTREETPGALWAFVTLACAGKQQVEAVRRLLPPVTPPNGRPTRVEFLRVRHAPQDCGPHQPSREIAGWQIPAHGAIKPVRTVKGCRRVPSSLYGTPHLGRGNGGWLLLGYGGRIRLHHGTDAFDFRDPHHRLKRFASLFDPRARLTDPVAFLERLHRKGALYERGRSRAVLTRLSRELGSFLNADLGEWLHKRCDFRRFWRERTDWQQRLAAVALDATRHVLDASVGVPDPFDQTGVLVINGIERWCARERRTEFLSLLDTLFPRLQFLLCAPAAWQPLLPASLRAKTLPVPRPLPRPRTVAPARLPRGTVLLVDVDGQLPNLALMKLSRHFQRQRKRVVLTRPSARMPRAETVFASCVFAFPQSARRVELLRQHYGANLEVGGSGVDLKRRLPPEIESLPPDFSLYPALGDRAIGFLTRGCPMHCRFCIVPIKEGKPRLASDFDGLLQGRSKLILLDDNLLAHSTAVELMEEMLRRDLQVNFNQTLDLRLLTPETAALLRRIRCSNARFTRRNYYFSLNNNRALDLVRRRYELLRVTGRDNVEFVCMYGFDTTLAQDVERFAFLRALPGAYVFLQRYRPPLGGPAPDLGRFFDERSDEWIDALLRINFTQNMKSMEVYYRWLCLLYAQKRGRIHPRLVETLYRYNHRHRMGGFLLKLEAIRRQLPTAAQPQPE